MRLVVMTEPTQIKRAQQQMSDDEVRWLRGQERDAIKHAGFLSHLRLCCGHLTLVMHSK